jgi:hypothetical protein
LNGTDTTGKLFNAGTHCNNSYFVGVVADVLCVRLFDPDEEKHVFLNVGYIGGTGKMCSFSGFHRRDLMRFEQLYGKFSLKCVCKCT